MSPGSGSPSVVDIGGTGIKGAAVDLETGELLAERIRLPTPSPATSTAVGGVVAEVLLGVAVDGPVGLTLPSVVREGIVETASNIHDDWIGLDAVELFSKTLGRGVGVVNELMDRIDSKTAALA